MIRVLVVDDHELIRTSISTTLRAAGMDVVGNCVDGHDAYGSATRLRPDVILMDLSMPRTDGVEATRQILATDPAARVVIFTSAVHGRKVKEALDLGAVGCVFKDAGTAAVIDAVQSAAAVA